MLLNGQLAPSLRRRRLEKSHFLVGRRKSICPHLLYVKFALFIKYFSCFTKAALSWWVVENIQCSLRIGGKFCSGQNRYFSSLFAKCAIFAWRLIFLKNWSIFQKILDHPSNFPGLALSDCHALTQLMTILSLSVSGRMSKKRMAVGAHIAYRGMDYI